MSANQKELLNDDFKILLEIEELPLNIYKGTFAILNLRYDLITYLETHPNSVRQFQARQILQPIEQLINSFNFSEKNYELIEEYQQAGNENSKFGGQDQSIVSMKKTRQQYVSNGIKYKHNYDEYLKDIRSSIDHVKKEIKGSYFSRPLFLGWFSLRFRPQETSRLYKVLDNW